MTDHKRWLWFLPLAACGGEQSSMQPIGPHARLILSLHHTFVAICTAVFVAVVLALAGALLGGRARARRASSEPMVFSGPGAGASADHEALRGEHAANRTVVVAIGLTVALLFILLVASVTTGRALAAKEPEQAQLIEITGHQWWWEIHYIDPDPSKIVVTANELHLPVGRPVRLRLRSQDVIHSFWVPRLHGKTDLIPGEERFTVIEADSPGIFRGQCAEFCGYQHAHMGLRVVAELPGAFEVWRQSQQAMGHTPETPEQTRGRQVFETKTCAMCHSVRGTSAFANRGPDLTHVASRMNLAAETIPNDETHLAQWILNPQAIKPGAQMPPNALPPDDIRALVAYVGALR
jgi:cytochrome c oxidase subunit 2